MEMDTILVVLVIVLAVLVIYHRIMIQRIKYMAQHDFLSGLLNKLGMYDLITKYIKKSKEKKEFALLYIDLDNFKHINNVYGHSTGDYVLKVIATKVAIKLPDGAELGRLSGDEFIVFFKDYESYQKIKECSEIVLQTVSKPIEIFGEGVENISASIGIALYPYHGATLEDLLKHCDTALYQAKLGGKNQFVMCSEEIMCGTSRPNAFFHRMKEAMDNDEFIVYYQPIVGIKSNKIVGVEALVRWDYPERGIVLPKEFIDTMEFTGDIVPLGRWVFEQSIMAYKQIKEVYDGEIYVSINISMQQLIQNDIVLDFASILRKHYLSAKHFCLEVKEVTFLEKNEFIVNNIIELKKLGFRFVIDDFGIKYSILSILDRLEADIIKVDKYFIDHIEDNYSSNRVLNALVDISKELNKVIIAEGVETEKTHNLLIGAGFDGAQGFLYHRPMPLRDLLHLVKKQND